MNDILDSPGYVNSDAWDSATRVKISDAIIEVNDHVRKVKYGRYLLFLLAAINFFVPLLSLVTTDEITPQLVYANMIGFGVAALPYLIFGVLYPRNPRLFLLLGLVTFVSFLLLSILLLGQGLLDGYQLNLAALAAFGFTFFSVARWKENLKKLVTLGYPSSALEAAKKQLQPLPRLRKKKRV